MEDVITLSSESDSDKEDSDVEIVGSYSNNMLTKADPLPLTEVRVDVDAVMNVKLPTPYIDLTDPRWTLPELKIRKRPSSTSLPLVDLTEWDITNGTKQDTENLPPDDNQKKNESIDHHTPNKEDFNLQRSSSIDPPGFALQQNCGNLEPNRSHMDFQIQQQSKTDEAEHHAPSVKLRRLSFLETHATELSSSGCPVYVTKDCTKMSLQPRQLGGNSEEPQCISHTASNGPHMEPSLHESSQVIEPPVRQHHASSNEFTSNQLEAETTPHVQRQSHSPCPDKGSPVANPTEHITHEDERSDLGSSIPIPSPTSPSSSQHKAQDSLQRDIVCSNLEHVESDQADSRQSCLPDPPAPEPPSTGPDPSELFNYDSWSHISPTSPNFESQVRSLSISEHTLTENTSEWQSEEFQADKASNRESIPRKSPSSVLETEDMDAGSGTGTYGGDLEFDNPLSYLWEEESDGERTNQESRFDTDFREVCREDRHFVCPAALRKIMSGPAQALVDDVDEGFGTPEVLCRQSLSLVYSTIDEKYPEGTLQLLSDLLQPGYYPPKDITSHLLHGIMLEPQCPYHLCVQAFNLLIRTQRHHMADRKTVPWNWELLTSVMSDQDDTKVYRSEVVRMLLEYIVQTLEDDFQAKLSTSSVHHSIAKAMLSCDQQFPRVRDVIKWLFSAIMKSTEPGENREAARERDEHVRMVSIFQRMLSLALEVDRSPALNSAKLSQELFHMLISSIPLRAHRMLLLESLQSKLLRCKLVEHLLDYACPVKVSLPMSLSLLLHFMKNCTLAPDPMDGAEMWQRWEELVHLLWMLLLSYNKAMNGYLCSSITEQKGRVGTMVYKQDDMVSKSAVLEAVESFLSRSQADLGQALPLHVEESLSYLQDHLLDVCQC